MLFNGTLCHQTRLKECFTTASLINFRLMHILALVKHLTWILIFDILVSIIIEHRILLKLTLTYLSLLESLVHLQSTLQIIFAI
jgi:hypothetical protein